MSTLLNYPVVVFAITFALLWLAAVVGGKLNRKRPNISEDLRSDYGVILAATLTLLGLVIGFSFSMAAGRYDLRKIYEEAEANAIGTEYVRTDLLPVAERTEVKTLLRQYTDLRIQFYMAQNEDDLAPINRKTAQIQDAMWAAVSTAANSQPTPVMAVATTGMNDVLNSQGYTQAEYWNRIPEGAWDLMIAIAFLSNVLVGYGARLFNVRMFTVLPFVVAVSFFLIADIDSPRGGVIRVVPQNLLSLQAGLR